METWQLVLTILSSGVGVAIIEWLLRELKLAIDRKRNKKDKIDVLTEKVDKLEEEFASYRQVTSQSQARVEIMMLINDYPEKWEDITKKAENYFCVLGGDSYLTGLFADWLVRRGLQKPQWFCEHLRKEQKK